MATTAILASRVAAELNMLVNSPPPGVSCWPVGDSITDFEAVIIGAEGTPYERGHFKLSITLPTRYPMEPPRCLFKTRVYHPNIDEGGRICLDILNLPPKGTWKPSLNISTMLMSLRLLLSNPNPDDPLVGHISDQYLSDHETFLRIARAHTELHAIPKSTSSSSQTANSDTKSQETKVEPTQTSAPPRKPQVRSLGLSLSKPSSSSASSAGKKEEAHELDAQFAPAPKQAKIENDAPSPLKPTTSAPYPSKVD